MSVRRLPPNEASELLAQGYVYVDVRSIPEFKEGHPTGAENIPFTNDFPAVFATRFPAKDAKVVVGCKMGGRSQRAAELMASDGYSELVNVTGGFDQWLAMGLPVTK